MDEEKYRKISVIMIGVAGVAFLLYISVFPKIWAKIGFFPVWFVVAVMFLIGQVASNPLDAVGGVLALLFWPFMTLKAIPIYIMLVAVGLHWKKYFRVSVAFSILTIVSAIIFGIYFGTQEATKQEKSQEKSKNEQEVGNIRREQFKNIQVKAPGGYLVPSDEFSLYHLIPRGKPLYSDRAIKMDFHDRNLVKYGTVMIYTSSSLIDPTTNSAMTFDQYVSVMQHNLINDSMELTHSFDFQGRQGKIFSKKNYAGREGFYDYQLYWDDNDKIVDIHLYGVSEQIASSKSIPDILNYLERTQ